MAEDASKFVLLASPNWYCSSVADCSLTKIYAFGARNCVYLLDVSADKPVFHGQLVGHTERVSSVCFSKHKLHANFVASGSDDKTVKIWDTETKLKLLEHKAHNAKVTCLTWSPVITDLVVSGDEKGQIIAWRYEEGNVFGGTPVLDHIFSMALSYLSESELAVGYKSGLILLLNVSSEGGLTIIHKLQGHSSEIHSLAFCPTPKEHIDFGPLQDKTNAAKGHLLVSGSRDQTIRLWDTAQGKVLSVKQLPKRSGQRWKDKHDSHWAKDRLWLSLCWPVASPGHVITSGQGGELLLWDLSKEGKEQCQMFGLGHSRIVFNISCDVGGTRIMTVSMDRQIVIWDPQHLRSLHTLPTLGGFAYSVAISPLDPGTLGVGVGDNMLRVWQTTSSMGPYETLTLWQGIKSKVMVVKWHPRKEGLLAFGADDGQVGVYNIINKRAEMSATYHKKTVYSLSWGPPCPKADNEDSTTHNLYSCAGDGSVLQHRTGHFMDDPVDVNALILKTNNLKHKPFGRTDVSWNLDGTVLALGNEDGSIEVYVPPDLMQVAIIITHKKSITTLVWHHGYSELNTSGLTVDDSGSCKYWLASGSNESTIHVHDLSSLLGHSSAPSPRSAPLTESFRQLPGHSGRVTCLSWSPHQSELLLSSSYDGTAQVWDVKKGEPLYNFRGHSSRVMCVVWSYLDADLVYSGGEDGTVRPWRPSLQQNRQPPVPEKKSSHSTSKSSKSKKNKHKPKGKAETTEVHTESWREEREPKPDSNGARTAHSQQNRRVKSQETEVSFYLEPNEPQSNLDDEATSEKGEIVKSQQDKRERKANVEENEEKNVKENGGEVTRAAELKGEEPEIEEMNPPEMNSPELTMTEQRKAGMVFQQKPVVPLRSRVTLEASSSSSSKKKRKVKSMLPLSAVADNKSKAATQEECVELAKIIYGLRQADSKSSEDSGALTIAGSEELVNLGLFADRCGAYRMLASEGQHHEESGNLDYKLQLEIWKGNLGGALEMATKSKQLNDWLVALSPLAGRDVWMSITRAYADQLASQGSYHRAVLYYLACHDTYKAIEVFKTQAMYREAIALAKVRLSHLDPVLFDLYSTWARKLETDSSCEQAAKCYLAVHSSCDAVRVLSRRGDQSSLRTALQVALLSDESELAVSLSLRLAHSYLMASNWQEAHEVLISCPGVEAHILNLCVHELLLVAMIEDQIISNVTCDVGKQTKISSFLKSEEISTKPSAMHLPLESNCYVSPWVVNKKPRKWFIACVLEAWYHCGAFKPDSTATLFQTLKTYYESISTGTETIQEILSRMSLEITLGMLSALTGNLYGTFQYWLQSLSSCNKNCLFSIQRQLCCMLLPDGIGSLDNLVRLSHELSSGNGTDEPTKEKDVEKLFHHLQAYYCKALVTELWYRCPEVLDVFYSERRASVEEESAKESEPTEQVNSKDDMASECKVKGDRHTEFSYPTQTEAIKKKCSYLTSVVVTDKSSDSKDPLSSSESASFDKQGVSEDDLTSESTLDKDRKGDISLVEITCEDTVNGDAMPKVGACLTALDVERKSLHSKEHISSLETINVVKQDFVSTLRNAKVVLLSDHHAKLNNQRALLVEIRKVMLLQRSRQFLQSGSTSSQLNQRKKNDKKPKTQPAKPIGFSASSSDVGSMRKLANSGETVESVQTGSKTNDVVDELLESAGATLEVEGRSSRKEYNSSIETLDWPRGSVAERKDDGFDDLKTMDGKVPIDLRYVASDASLQFLADEEEKILKELEQFDLKDLPFPSPMESALTIASLAACSHGLPVTVTQLWELGTSTLQWAQTYAQTSTDLKGVRRLTRTYNKVA